MVDQGYRHHERYAIIVSSPSNGRQRTVMPDWKDRISSEIPNEICARQSGMSVAFRIVIHYIFQIYMAVSIRISSIGLISRCFCCSSMSSDLWKLHPYQVDWTQSKSHYSPTFQRHDDPVWGFRNLKTSKNFSAMFLSFLGDWLLTIFDRRNPLFVDGRSKKTRVFLSIQESYARKWQ
jgi:hypothetical protein